MRSFTSQCHVTKNVTWQSWEAWRHVHLVITVLRCCSSKRGVCGNLEQPCFNPRQYRRLMYEITKKGHRKYLWLIHKNRWRDFSTYILWRKGAAKPSFCVNCYLHDPGPGGEHTSWTVGTSEPKVSRKEQNSDSNDIDSQPNSCNKGS